jgi:predicted Zn-dependent peptidase
MPKSNKQRVSLRAMQEFDLFELPNGIRVVHKQVKRPVAHFGFMVSAGARDEQPDETGLAHYIEHILFKGTEKRKAYHILSRMEDVGGELNAYTSKEETVIYSAFLSPDYKRAVELICDIAFHSNFPSKELEKEKEVIIDEINSYKDSPAELIFDDFETMLFPDHPLGKSILGTPESVRSFNQEKVQHFIQREYAANRIVFSSVGNISTEKLKKMLWSFVDDYPASINATPRTVPAYAAPSAQRLTKNVYQTHAIIGGRAYPAEGEKARTLLLLNNLLGGPGMNSRLNLNIREKYGFTYNIESFYNAYVDSGLFGVYLGTEAGNADRTISLVHKELKKLREQKLGALQLSKAKRQLLGQVAMAQENNGSLMLGYGKSLLSYNRVDTFAEIQKKVEGISAAAIQEVANEIFAPSDLSTLIYEAKK